MSIVSRQLSRGLAHLVRQEGQGAVSVRLGTTGAFTALVGALLHRSALDPGYSDTLGQEQRSATATLTVPWDLPAMGEGWQVQEADGTTWAITSGPHGSSARIYGLTRDTTTKTGGNRGRIPR